MWKSTDMYLFSKDLLASIGSSAADMYIIYSSSAYFSSMTAIPFEF